MAFVHERLNKRVIDNATYLGSGRSMFIIWDTKTNGFGLRVHPSGRKIYTIYYKNQSGQRKYMSIGCPSTLTLEQARNVAKTNLGQNAQGQDPLAAKIEKSRGETFKDFSVDYIENYAKERKKSWKEDERRIQKHLIPAFGSSKLKNIDSTLVTRLHKKIKVDTSLYEANRTLALISKIFNYAKSVSSLPSSCPNPASGVEKFKETSRDRWLSKVEIDRLNQALLEEPNIYIQKSFILLLLTGARKNELLTAKWENVDWDRSELLIEDTKAGEAQRLYLNASAIEHLKELPMVEANPYIFVGAKEGRHLVNIHKAWTRLVGRADLKKVRIHDLRRTLGSRLVQSGHSLKLIQEILRHKHSKTTEIYARISDNQKKTAMENIYG